MAKAKSDYHTRMISNNPETPRHLWNCINQILHILHAPSLPKHVSLKPLCDSFYDYFRDTVRLIRSTFSDHASNRVNVDPPLINSPLAAFTHATVEEVRKIIMSSPNKSCDLDPLHTTLLKACLDSLVNPITNIINTSLCSGMLPDDFKQVQVSPLLKKTSLPKDYLNSYIPISNLSFISKTLERVAASRLRSHIRLNVYLMYHNQHTNSFTLQGLLS